MKKIIVICGPTGVGKTGFAIALAKRFDGEIVGADSMQIYRRMDIGTAKPTAGEQAAAVHHMVDVIEPDEDFDAAEYARRAEPCIASVIGRGRLPFVVGGTGLYIKALIYGLTEAAPSDNGVRDRLKADLARYGGRIMHERLKSVDPPSARRIHTNDTYRILRALEVHEITGRPISEHHNGHRFSSARFDPLQIGLTMSRPALYDRIDRRVDGMLEQGLLEEVRSLMASGYSTGLKSMQSLGYRHMAAYLSGQLTWHEAVRTLKRDHRRYAKRQLTWFGADERIQWLHPDQLREATDLIRIFLGGAAGD